MNDADKKKVQKLIDLYQKEFPDFIKDGNYQTVPNPDAIKTSIDSAKKEKDELKKNGALDKDGKVQGTSRRLSVAIPTNLYMILRKEYPVLFTKHIDWFKKNFEQFVIE